MNGTSRASTPYTIFGTALFRIAFVGVATACVLTTIAAAADDILIADFESDSYGKWQAEGEAFGPGPAKGTLPGQMYVSGYKGQRLVNSFFGGDRTTGRLTSPPFEIQRDYINFLVGGGAHPGKTCINLIVGGKVVRTATGPNDRPGGSERLRWASWDVKPFRGRKAIIEIVDDHTGGWGHINVDHIVQSDKPRRAPTIQTSPLYRESYRPQFHFTAAKNWLNDPNGLVYYNGEYHLFFQHNPKGIQWGNMTWGHAVSKDLVHWKQLDHAIRPDEHGTIFSGSAVVDEHNTSGFGRPGKPPLVCAFTYAGRFGNPPRPFTQGIAYSLDGRSFTKYPGNPVLQNLAPGNRDPKVFWHAPSRQWVMVLYVRRGAMHLFHSPDLKKWTPASICDFPDAHECPELFELPVDGDANNTRWVLWEGAGRHMIGRFDGTTFTPETDVLPSEWGRNCYAGQTFNNEPHGRRVFIAWMRGGEYPGMPFNQQMSFPRRFTLRTTADGIRLHQQPVEEIKRLYANSRHLSQMRFEPGDDPLAGFDGELYDLDLLLDPAEAERITFGFHGHRLDYDTHKQTLSAFGRTVSLPAFQGPLRLRMLIDRTSIEIFANDGRIVMSYCFVPDLDDYGLSLRCEGGSATVADLEIHELKPIWPQ